MSMKKAPRDATAEHRWRIVEKTLVKPGITQEVSKENAHLLKNVLRLNEGQLIEITDGRGTVQIASIATQSKQTCAVRILSETTYDAPITRVHLLIGLPKAKTLPEAVHWASEHGASSTHFFRADFSQHYAVNHERAARIAEEAIRITKSPWMNSVLIHETLESALQELPIQEGLLLMCDESPLHEEPVHPIPHLKDRLASAAGVSDIVLAIGPESSFSLQERQQLSSHSFQPCSLGNRILTVPGAIQSALCITNAWLSL